MRTFALLLLAACGPDWESTEPELVCEEIGYALASRVFSCTGDADRSQALHDDYRSRTTCLAEPLPSPLPDLYHCSSAILELPCAEVENNGEDLASWLSASEACDYAVALREEKP